MHMQKETKKKLEKENREGGEVQKWKRRLLEYSQQRDGTGF